MTQQETLEYNKRCTEFLGDEGMQIICSNNIFYDLSLEKFLFDSDWNWIMHVVECIEKKGYEIDIFSNCVEICDIPYENYITESVGKTKKEAVVRVINKFLILYEQNK